MVRRITKREEELAEIYEPYLYSPDDYHFCIREDAPQEAKDAFKEKSEIVRQAYLYELGYDPFKNIPE